MNMKPPLERTANQLAQRGRFGDTQLVHMNPAEVSGLAAMSPTGELTINPDTGQPEAFLPLLAPLIGSTLGTAALGGTALGMAGAGALGSGLATWAATGDLEKGLVSGITGFGMGQVLGAGADAANQGVSQALEAVDAAQAGVTQAGQNVLAANQAVPTSAMLADASPPLSVNPFDPTNVTFQQAAGVPAFSPEQAAYASQMGGLEAAQTTLDTARAGMSPFERSLGGFTDPKGLAAMGKAAMSPQAMLPMAVGLGTQAEMEQQEYMDDMRKQAEMEDAAYAAEWQAVLDNALGVADRSSGGRYTPGLNPYGRVYSASGGRIGMQEGGMTYEDMIDDDIFFANNPNAIPYNSSFSDPNAFDPYAGTNDGYDSGGGSITEGNDPYTLQTEGDEVGSVVTNTAADTASVIAQGADPSNIITTNGGAAGQVAKGQAAISKGLIGNVTTGIDPNTDRYFVTATPETGAERQALLRGMHKIDPPSDYRHGFEEEFQFFDYIDDRPLDRYLDAFGGGPSDYLAGLLGVTDHSAPSAPGTNPLATYTETKGDQFSGTTGGISNEDAGMENLEADSLLADCYTKIGEGQYDVIKADANGVCPIGYFRTQAQADAAAAATDTTTTTTTDTTTETDTDTDTDTDTTTVTDTTDTTDTDTDTDTTTTTNVLYDAAGNEYEVGEGWTNSTVASYLADGTLSEAEMAGIANLLELSTDEGDAAIMETFGAFDDSFGTQFQDYLDSLETTEPVIPDGPPPETSCPSPDTLIKLKDGETTAGELKVGDLVHTQHEHTLEWGDWPVTHVEIVENQPRLKLSFDDKEIVCSWSHKFYVDGHDGVGLKTWVKAEDMKIGDVVNGKALHGVRWWSDGDVVKITVDEAHTYIAADLLSHNKLPGEPPPDCPAGHTARWSYGTGWACVPDTTTTTDTTDTTTTVTDTTDTDTTDTTDTSTVDIDDVASGSIALLATQEDINALVDGVVDGSLSAQSIADHYNVDVDDVQDEIDTILSNRLDDVDQEGIEYLLSEINAGNLTAAEVAARYGLTEAEVQNEVDLLNARGAEEAAISILDDPQGWAVQNFGEGPYTQEQALLFAQEALASGLPAADAAEAFGVDEAVVQGFYDQSLNPVDMTDAQAQTAVIDQLGLDEDVYTADDFVGLSEAEIAEIFGLAGGGRTRRFMTAMGPVELAAGGLADVPVNAEFMQEIVVEEPTPEQMLGSAVGVEEARFSPAVEDEISPLPSPDAPDYYDELVTMTIEAIRGSIDDVEVVNAVTEQFIEEYGIDKYQELRQAVLQDIVPDAQTEGLIAGTGGGMDDEVMGMIGTDQEVAVSPGEYIVAADVLSGLGDGDTNAGADVMDEVSDRVRAARTGGRQPAPLDLSRILPV